MPKLPIKKKLDGDPEKKPNTAGNWEGFARNIALGMNQTQAYIAAGYSENGARQSAAVLVRKPHVQRLLWELGQKADIEPVSVLRTLREQMLADIGDLFDEDGTFDFAAAIASGRSRLIKKIKFDDDTGRIKEIEMYDAQGAAKALLSVCGLEQAPRVNDADKKLLEVQINKVMETMGLDEQQARLWLHDNVPAARKFLM